MIDIGAAAASPVDPINKAVAHASRLQNLAMIRPPEFIECKTGKLITDISN
jgi:hypothetical protein